MVQRLGQSVTVGRRTQRPTVGCCQHTKAARPISSFGRKQASSGRKTICWAGALADRVLPALSTQHILQDLTTASLHCQPGPPRPAPRPTKRRLGPHRRARRPRVRYPDCRQKEGRAAWLMGRQAGDGQTRRTDRQADRRPGRQTDTDRRTETDRRAG